MVAIPRRHDLSFRTNLLAYSRHRHGAMTDAVAVVDSRIVDCLAADRSVPCTDLRIDPYMMVTCSSLRIIIEMNTSRT